MNRDDAEEYTEALGQIAVGSWRQAALGDRLGVPAALGLTTREWVSDRLGGYVRLAVAERREAVVELTSGDEPLSNVKAAEVLGVSEGTVRNDRTSSQKCEEGSESEVTPQVKDTESHPSSQDCEPEPEPVPAPQEPTEAIAEFLDSDDDLNRARYRSAISRAMVRARTLFEFKAEDVAKNADLEFLEDLDEYITDVQNYVQRVRRAMPPGLRAVNGGKS